MLGQTERDMLDDLLDGDIASGLALLDRLNDVRDPRWEALSQALGGLVVAVEESWNGHDPAVEDLVETRWSRAFDARYAFDQFADKVSALFWHELHSLRDLGEIQSLLKRSLDLCRETDMVAADGK